MRNLLGALFLFTCIIGKAQTFGSYGVVLLPADSLIRKNIHLVKIGHTTSVVFPAEYGKRRFGKNSDMIFFTPDTGLVKSINKEIVSQYCIANERFIVNFWQKKLKVNKDDTIALNKAFKLAKLESSKHCSLWKVNSTFYDKQFIGYFSKSGEKMLLINMLDFRQDPYKLKSNLDVTWIDGWHGWFYSNTIQLHYNIDRNLLTIDEDI